jgi:hypothetical protein
LPTLLALILLGWLAWSGLDVARSLWADLSRAVERATTDQVPTAADPRLTSGPIPGRGLLLNDNTPAWTSPEPGAPAAETIGQRRIVDLLNVWPLRGEPTHFRVGSERPFGWITADQVLRWDTRLVVRADGQPLPLKETPGAGASAESPQITALGLLPILAIDERTESVQLAVWDREAPWRRVRQTGWLPLRDLPADRIEVLVSRAELLALLRLDPVSANSPSPRHLRLEAALGRLLDDAPPDPQSRDAPRRRLAPILDRVPPSLPLDSFAALSRINENWRPDATWGGVPFRGIPLDRLP